jgi:ribonuclease R
MLSVLRQYNLPLSFPKDVLTEARIPGTVVAEQDLAGRVDCRSHRVITIDPDDAKDFDDAICVEPAGEHRWRVWVHIADVSHYVRPGTALDKEARRRGNSTYLVDRVIPMLPEALSNELCSLKPGVDRLTKCVEFLVGDDGRVHAARFHSAVIHSKRRYTYQEALLALGRAPADAIEHMLHDAHRLAQRIRKLRFTAGSLELDFPEMKVRLDEKGQVARIERMENDISHQLIEEYMLLANEAVAARLMSLRRPALHRVHEEPAELRLRDYREEVLSHDIPCGNLRQRPEIQKLLHKLSGLPIGPALKIGFLRSLMRARYAVEPLGHYGLAKARYTHFTSPIRRYADLVVHRALFDPAAAPASSLRDIADHLSATERTSADAERDSRDVKLFAYLRKQLASGHPEPYPALVTELRNFGFFVDVPGLGMNGVVPLSLVEEDFFQLDTAGNRLVGRRTRRIIRIGDRITVEIARVDVFKKQVDFRLAKGTTRPGSPTAPGARSRPSRAGTGAGSGRNRTGAAPRAKSGRGQGPGRSVPAAGNPPPPPARKPGSAQPPRRAPAPGPVPKGIPTRPTARPPTPLPSGRPARPDRLAGRRATPPTPAPTPPPAVPAERGRGGRSQRAALKPSPKPGTEARRGGATGPAPAARAVAGRSNPGPRQAGTVRPGSRRR